MAQVKFNRGTWRTDGLGDNDISFLQATAQSPTGSAASSGDYGFIYVGSILSATKYIKALDTKGYTTPSQSITPSGGTATTHYKDALMYIGHNTSTNVLDSNITGLLGIDTADIVGLDGYTAGDTSIMTSAGVAEYVTSVASLVDIYHGTGVWDSANNNPFKYIAKCYVSGTEVQAGGTNYQALEFTIPTMTSSSTTGFATDDTHLVTPAAVANYFATLAGGMRYRGVLTSTTAPTGTKPGDVFIAGTGGIAALGAEENDMIIVNENYTTGNLTNANTDVFERNIDGAVSTSETLSDGKLILGAGSKTVKGLATAKGDIVYSTDANTIGGLGIGTVGQRLQVVNTASSGDPILLPRWQDNYELKIAAATGTNATGIDVFLFKNGSAAANASYHGQTFDANGKINIPITAGSATSANTVVQTSKNTGKHAILFKDAITTASTPASGSADGVDYNTTVAIDAANGNLEANDVKVMDSGTQINVSASIIWHDLS